MQLLTRQISIQQSRFWQTNTGLISGPEGTLLIDPGVYADEMETIAVAAGSVVAGFCTHAHWDHVLWHQRFGIDTPRYASAETVALIHANRGEISQELDRIETEESDHPQWDRSLLFLEHPLPWGPAMLAGIECELVSVAGHENGQAALLLPEHRVCFVADTLSDVETPSFYDGSRSIAQYLETIDRLHLVIERVDWIVSGHGSPADPQEAQRRLDADRRYLQALPPAVAQAGAGESVEDIARKVLHQLDEHRADSKPVWNMHVDNIMQLLAEQGRGA